jgi:oxygen-independent coproporphyrinogen III oxidase
VSETAERVGLYVSVPFCRAKCSFCNFASGVGSTDAVNRYIGLLCEEIRASRQFAVEVGAVLPRHADTVYFGGGTPSLLSPEQFGAVMAAIRGEFEVADEAEITLEAAPGQISDELLEAALTCGVNRFSLGVQSFVNREAQAVGRAHTEAICLGEIARLRTAGVHNLGVDLIAGLPYQTPASWDRSLEIVSTAGLEHVSVYMLEIDDESRLGREVLGGGARLHAPAVASDDLIAELYERACDVLPGAGLQQYEISNFGQDGRRSKHNLKYWWREPYLGFGLDAHSMLVNRAGSAVRWANPEELQAYVGPASVRTPERIDSRGAYEESVFLGLRIVEGLPWRHLERFRAEWLQALREGVRALSESGLMSFDTERCWLTARGRLLSGEVFGELLAGVAA